jgi:hypothetical protein
VKLQRIIAMDILEVMLRFHSAYENYYVASSTGSNSKKWIILQISKEQLKFYVLQIRKILRTPDIYYALIIFS